MKTKIISAVLVLLGSLGLPGQAYPAPDGEDYLTVYGTVKDARNKKVLSYVNVTVPGTHLGTVTNSDGGFSVKIRKELDARYLEFSHLGYVNKLVEIPAQNYQTISVTLAQDVMQINEIVVRFTDPRELVRKAIEKMEDNYSMTADRLTGFYRETIRKRERYITVSEAVLTTYKTPYSGNINKERIAIEKGRQLLSPRSADTLMVKLQAGPYQSIYADIVKNPNLILNEEELEYYNFTLESPVMINDRPNYVVSFIPGKIMPYAMLEGRLFIDYETLAFVRAEMRFDMRDPGKTTQLIMQKKPMGLRFKPEELLPDHLQGAEWSLYTELCPVADQVQMRLAKTAFFNELHRGVRNGDHRQGGELPGKTFHAGLIQAYAVTVDEVLHFYDPEFWKDYNIIEPTESLETAVDRLKKRHK